MTIYIKWLEEQIEYWTDLGFDEKVECFRIAKEKIEEMLKDEENSGVRNL